MYNETKTLLKEMLIQVWNKHAGSAQKKCINFWFGPDPGPVLEKTEKLDLCWQDWVRSIFCTKPNKKCQLHKLQHAFKVPATNKTLINTVSIH